MWGGRKRIVSPGNNILVNPTRQNIFIKRILSGFWFSFIYVGLCDIIRGKVKRSINKSNIRVLLRQLDWCEPKALWGADEMLCASWHEYSGNSYFLFGFPMMECKHFSAKFFFLFVVVGSALEVGQNVRLMYIHCKWIDALHILTRPSFVFVSRAKEKIDAISFFFFFCAYRKDAICSLPVYGSRRRAHPNRRKRISYRRNENPASKNKYQRACCGLETDSWKDCAL